MLISGQRQKRSSDKFILRGKFAFAFKNLNHEDPLIRNSEMTNEQQAAKQSLFTVYHAGRLVVIGGRLQNNNQNKTK